METEEKEIPQKELEELTVDFSKQTLKKIERANIEEQFAVALILDDNEIQRLDNLDSYRNLKKLSLVNNLLIRMYGVSHLIHLVELDLSKNSLVTIEGLKDLLELKRLNLANNKIKTIEHLNSNLKLEKIDLSENNIIHISDVSYLQNLKELNLHGNKISHLRQCEKNLPENLEILTLNGNSICDLNEISYLVHLTSLKELSIECNPCVDFSENEIKFNYRPFVKNWCSSLIVLDNFPLDDIECLKAEWLYSQGRGRSFRPGEHVALAEYLTSVCPKKAEQNAETEDVKKLKLILSKAQLHQQQLREQIATGKFGHISKKKSTGISERMVISFQDCPSKELRYSPELMTRSLDSSMLRNSPCKTSRKELNQTPLQTSTTFIPIPDTLISPDVSQPLIPTYQRPSSISSKTSHSSSRNSPHSTPESKRKTFTNISRRQNENSSPIALRKQEKLLSSRSSTPFGKSSSSRNTFSPIERVNNVKEPEKSYRETSEEEDSDILALKVLAVQQRANQRRLNKKNYTDIRKGKGDGKENLKEKNIKNEEKELTENETWKAAVCIQRRWRGYRARNLDKKVLSALRNIQMNRMQDYITKVVKDMEATRVALEGNRKLQVLQMQAINALWKKMTALQPSEAVENLKENKANLQSLVETCSSLHKQVEGLQIMMRALQTSSNSCPSIPIATQTEIVAVHTPQGEERENFLFSPKLKTDPTSLESHHSNDLSFSVPEDRNSISFQKFTKDLENGSTSDTATTVTELFANSSLIDSSREVFLISEFQESKEPQSSFLSEALIKPSVNLNETSCELLISSTKELEKSKENIEFSNENNT